MIISSDRDSSDLTSIVESEICPLCKQPNTIIADPESTDIVCSKCGMVLSDSADTRLE
jgi:transcription initiation factor TFIIIB Brf1 subunit/transcription initiation factor TFIIB